MSAGAACMILTAGTGLLFQIWLDAWTGFKETYSER